MEYLILWALHSLGWFIFSCVITIITREYGVIKIMSTAGIGLMSAVFQTLLKYYLGG